MIPDSTISPNKRSVSFISLGCPKNLVDSEDLVATFLRRGYRVLSEAEHADLVVVNTCGFLEASRAESITRIREAVALKDKGVKGVLVAGCMVGNYKDILDREAPGVDRLVPFADYAHVDRIAAEILPESAAPTFTLERLRADVSLTPGHYAYLKISEGCNHTCAFCVIPDIRGPMRSFPLEDLVQRARTMADRGVRELNLIAQDSTVYGTDLYGAHRLEKLLARLDGIAGLKWIRLLYAYPTELMPGVMDRLAQSERILPYLDVPIQHAADGVLKRMRRGYGRADLEKMVSELRRRRPDIALRTTVIVGFPGETDEDFEVLLRFIREVGFDRLGAFRYSREPGSRADALDGHLEASLKDERWHRLMAAQQDIAFAKNAAFQGSVMEVLVDAPAEGDRPAVARSFRDAPEIDQGVLIADPMLRAGDFAEVAITGTRGYDLLARVITPPYRGESV